ncbi:NVEALA domain-containing protein [Bacteroidales bacterium OttesenSCG-928-L03]|nr:NVEALA domain-containing protein [Bacteroidales bacterium OttesenSCG-928-L03]
MKKKIIGGIAIIVVAITVAFNVNVNNESNNRVSFLSLANVEALASESGGFGETCYETTIYSNELSEDLAFEVFNCGNCSEKIKAHSCDRKKTCR